MLVLSFFSTGRRLPIVALVTVVQPGALPISVAETGMDIVEMGEDRPLGELVADYASADIAGGELECLASAVYFESKGEPLEGQLAVAEVILNRVKSPKFPDTICGVVKQRNQF